MLLTCEGTFLGLVETDASYVAKKGDRAGEKIERTNRTLDVYTAKGSGTLNVSERAFEALRAKLSTLTPMQSQVIVAVEATTTYEYVAFERVPRVQFDVVDVEVLGASAPRANGSKAAASASAGE